MRLAMLSRPLLLLALPAMLVTCAAAQDHPNVRPSSIRDQLNNPPAKSQPAPAAAKAPAPAQQPKVPAKAPSKAKRPAKAAAAPAPAKAPAAVKAPAKTTEKKPKKTPVEKPAEAKVSAAKRDPFDPLLNKPSQGTETPQNLPPDGIVGGAKGMIAIVSNPQQRVYFLREGDKLYDGSVQHITIEAVSFQEVGKDAFGKPLERQVTKRLYPSPGEQQ